MRVSAGSSPQGPVPSTDPGAARSGPYAGLVILIVVKWPVRPEFDEQWPELVREFTEAVRAEPGNEFFEWSRSVDQPHTWVLVEGFRDAGAGAVHTGSAHFRQAIAEMPDWISATPSIMYVDSPDLAGWGPMGEVQPRG